MSTETFKPRGSRESNPTAQLNRQGTRKVLVHQELRQWRIAPAMGSATLRPSETEPYFHLKILSATKKLTTPQTATIAS